MLNRDHAHHLDLSLLPELEAMGFERLLAEALRDVIAELFFVNAANLIAYINTDKTANIEDLVASAAEHSLPSGTLKYGGHACTQFDWGCPPNVLLNLEFRHETLAIYFQLVFDAKDVGVAISSIVFRDAADHHDARLRRFEAALASTRRRVN